MAVAAITCATLAADRCRGRRSSARVPRPFPHDLHKWVVAHAAAAWPGHRRVSAWRVHRRCMAAASMCQAWKSTSRTGRCQWTFSDVDEASMPLACARVFASPLVAEVPTAVDAGMCMNVDAGHAARPIAAPRQVAANIERQFPGDLKAKMLAEDWNGGPIAVRPPLQGACELAGDFACHVAARLSVHMPGGFCSQHCQAAWAVELLQSDCRLQVFRLQPRDGDATVAVRRRLS